MKRIAVRDGEKWTRRKNQRLPMSMKHGRGSKSVMSLRNISALRALYRVQDEGRDPTPTELDEMAQYAGFGGCQEVFQSGHSSGYLGLHRHRETLETFVSDVDYKAITRSISYAYYTPPPVARALWDTMAKMGFTGGLVLDPAFGTGNIVGSMPDDLRATTDVVGIDSDKVAATIGAYLYPQSTIYQARFQDMDTEPVFDAVVSNFPFGQDPVFDARYNKQEHKVLLTKIHNYFLGKSLDMLRSGGLLVTICSRYFMDSADKTMRRYMARRAELLGAFRLPANTFAGTSVVADILIFKKRDKVYSRFRGGWIERENVDMQAYVSQEELRRHSHYNWSKILERTSQHPISSYFADNPDCVLGEFREVSGPFGPELSVQGDTKKLGERIAEQIRENLNELPYEPVMMTCAQCGVSVHKRFIDLCLRCEQSAQGVSESGVTFNSMVLEGQYFLGEDRRIYQRLDGKAHVVNRQPKVLYRIKNLLVLHELAERVNKAETDDELRETVRKLGLRYAKFVAKYGYVNSRANRIAFGNDPRSPLVFALEYWDAEKEIGTPSEIFRRKTVRVASWPQTADSPQHAIAISLARYNEIKWGYISSLTGLTTNEAIASLEGKVFLDPDSGWQPAEAYLSGDVVSKLERARQANEEAATVDMFTNNIRALTAVQLKLLTKDEIWPGLGAMWIPVDIIQRFATELADKDSPLNRSETAVSKVRKDADDIVREGHDLGEQVQAASTNAYGSDYQMPEGWVTVNRNVRLGTWTCEGDYRTHNKMTRTKWGTDRIDAIALLNTILNGGRVTVKEKDPRTNKQVVSRIETVAAREKAKELQLVFERWLWADEERCSSMETLYNATMNRHVPRRYDGSHLVFPGMNPEIELRPKQRDAVWRGLQSNNVILWHRVGAGKTFAMMAMSMELRRLKMIERPMHVVPNHLLNQYANEFYRLYPQARILLVSSKMMNPKNRARYLAYMVTGDFDAIVITHSAFKLISVSYDTWHDFIQRELDMVDSDLFDAKFDEDRLNIRTLERQRGKLEARLEKMKHKASSKQRYGLYWEELGIDAVFFDEAHHMRNLFYSTKRSGLSGIGGSESGAAFDFFVKTQHMLRRCVCGRPLGVSQSCQCVRNERARPGKLVLATGTLLTNSIAELYTFMRYTMYDRLAQMNIEHFDSWASQFGQTVTTVEMSPGGSGFRQHERFSRFNNVPELQRLLAEVCDAQLDADELGLKLPKIEGGEPERIECWPCEAQVDIFTDCANRYDDLINGRLEWGEDNVLAIMGDAGRAALDHRLVNANLPEDPNSKINVAARLIAEIYHSTTQVIIDGVEGRHNLTTQVFLDNYESGNGKVNLYNDLIEKLVLLGVKRKEIAVAQKHNTDARKQKLQDDLNAGIVRVVIGSTQAMGEGWNVQRLAYAQIQLDAPWTPTAIEQRGGRIIRPDNLLKFVRLVRLVTADSLDFYRWHLLEQKLSFVFQIARSSINQRSIEDIDKTIVSFSQMKAIAAGDPLVMRQVELQAQIGTLHTLRQKWLLRQREIKTELDYLPDGIKSVQREMERAKVVETAVSPLIPCLNGSFALQVNGEMFHDEIEGRKALQRELNQVYKLAQGETLWNRRGSTLTTRERIARIGGAWLDVESNGNDIDGILNLGEDGPRIKMHLAKRGDTSLKRLRGALDYWVGRDRNLALRIHNMERSLAHYQTLIEPMYEREDEIRELELELAKVEGHMAANAERDQDSLKSK